MRVSEIETSGMREGLDPVPSQDACVASRLPGSASNRTKDGNVNWAQENKTPVPGATRYADKSSAIWERVVEHYRCDALTGAWLWRAMVTDLETNDVTYITPHQFTGPNEAMEDALRFAKSLLWD